MKYSVIVTLQFCTLWTLTVFIAYLKQSIILWLACEAVFTFYKMIAYQRMKEISGYKKYQVVD